MSAIRFFLVSILFTSIAHYSFASDVCQFKRFNDVTFQGCTDFNFSNALTAGDLTTVQTMVSTNPDYVFSCNQTENDFHDQYSALTFAVCNAGDKATLPAIVNLLLKNGADATCRSQVSHVTALQCANRIADANIRSQVIGLLKAAGAGE